MEPEKYNAELSRTKWISALLIVGGLIAIYFLTRGCPSGINNSLKSELAKAKESAAISMQLADHHKEIAQKHKDTAKMYREKDSLTQIQIALLREDRKKSQKEVQSFSTLQIADLFRRKYNPDEAISVAGNSISLLDTVSRQIASDVVALDYCDSELKLTNNRVNDLEGQITHKDSTNAHLERENKKVREAKAYTDGALQISEYIVKQTQAEVRSAKANGWVQMILGVLLGFAGGRISK